MIEVDVTTLIGILSAAMTAVGGIVGALWKTSQKAQASVVAQVVAELELERAESTRLHAKVAELYEQRHVEFGKLLREVVDFMAGDRRAREENVRALEAVKTLLERKGP